MSEAFGRVVSTLGGMTPTTRGEKVELQPHYQQFISSYPSNSISSLTLDQYCLGGTRKDSFCWWIERGLQPLLGRYMPGTARGHLLYRQEDGSVYKHRHLSDLPDEEALAYTLAIQQVVVNAARSDDVAWLDDDAQLYEKSGVSEKRVTIAKGRKLRLLSAYNPDAFVPVYSTDHLLHFLKLFGVPEKECPPRSQAVALSQKLYGFYREAQKGFPELTPKAFMNALYAPSSALNPPLRTEGGKRGELQEVAVADATDTGASLPLQVVARKEQNNDLNVILYGPPGTGKTYSAIEEAVRILDPKLLEGLRLAPGASEAEQRSRREKLKRRYDELRGDKRVEFVTFHQSFSYEDFVEGIRPEPHQDKLVYRVEDGMFKRLCLDAAATLEQADETPFDLGTRPVWKMSLGNTLGDEGHIYEECLRGGYVLMGYGSQIDFSNCNSKEDVRKRFEDNKAGAQFTEFAVQVVNRFKNDMKTGDVVVVSEGNRLVRAIGVVEGEYEYAPRDDEEGFAQKRRVRWLRSYRPSLPASDVVDGNLSQQTLYALDSPVLTRTKLAEILTAPAAIPASSVLREGQALAGTDYVIARASREIVTVRKPNGSDVSFSWSMLEALALHVKAGQITIKDIAEKRVFERLPQSRLEKNIVNAYNNVLWRLVQPLSAALTAASSAPHDAPRVLIIDEINRGNVSKIFGELISLIEPSKRTGAADELSVTLPYSKTEFSVPANVYIVGTMNSADRSLTGIDVALRRRFRFKEILPDEGVLAELEISSINISLLLKKLNERIELLLGRDFCLGHAYFCPLLELEDASLRDLAELFQYQILPLLEEHFFEDWERIGWVLNDHQAPAGVAKFLVRPDSTAEKLLGARIASGVRDSRWQINRDALLSAESYRNIIGSVTQ